MQIKQSLCKAGFGFYFLVAPGLAFTSWFLANPKYFVKLLRHQFELCKMNGLENSLVTFLDNFTNNLNLICGSPNQSHLYHSQDSVPTVPQICNSSSLLTIFIL